MASGRSGRTPGGLAALSRIEHRLLSTLGQFQLTHYRTFPHLGEWARLSQHLRIGHAIRHCAGLAHRGGGGIEQNT